MTHRNPFGVVGTLLRDHQPRSGMGKKKANECKRIVGVSVLMAGVSTEGAAEFNNKKVVYLLVDNAMNGLGLLST